MNMASVCVARFGQVGRRTAVKLMVVGAVGLMSLAGTNPALAAGDDQASFWTQFTPSVDTRLIFVSSSAGNDSNSGLTPATPVKTIARGYQLLRDGSPDWLLLKRGDTWVEALPNWDKSGRSESEKMVMGAYGEGDSRPQVRPPLGITGMNTVGNTKTDHVAFVGFHLEPEARADDSSPTGFRWLRRGEDILFEDLFVVGWGNNFSLQAFGDGVILKNFHINGCVITKAWSLNGRGQGVYASGVNGLTIKNSVIAANGYDYDRGIEPTVYCHEIYIQNNCEDVLVSDNVIADSGGSGIEFRSDGVLDNNLFINNAVSAHIGSGSPPRPGGISISIGNNIIMHGRGMTPSRPRSQGFMISNIRNADIHNNIFLHGEVGYNGEPLSISAAGGFGLQNVLVYENIVYAWPGEFSVVGPGDGKVFKNISIDRNVLVQDLNANDGNHNFNKSLVSVFDARDPNIQISGNHYRYYGMHNKPFRSAGQAVSVALWASQYELDGTFQSISEPLIEIGIDQYMESLGLGGVSQGFIEHASRLSRGNTDHRFMAGTVYEWAKNRVGD